MSIESDSPASPMEAIELDGTNDAISDAVRKLVCLIACVEEGKIDSSTPLFEHGLLDSFGMLCLAHAIEKKFGVPLTHHDLVPGNWSTVEKVASFIASRL